MPAPAHAVQHRVHRAAHRIRHAELRAEVRAVVLHAPQLVVDLVVQHDLFGSAVLYGDARAPAEGHGPVAVEPARRVHAYRQRRDRRVLVPSAAEEVPHGHLHRRRVLPVPVGAQYHVAPYVPAAGLAEGHPDVAHLARAFDPGDLVLLSRFEVRVGRHLPPASELPRVREGRPRFRHSSHAPAPRGILRGYRPRLAVRQAADRIQGSRHKFLLFAAQRRGMSVRQVYHKIRPHLNHAAFFIRIYLQKDGRFAIITDDKIGIYRAPSGRLPPRAFPFPERTGDRL